MSDDALSPRPTRDHAESLRVLAEWSPDGDDATALRVLSDQLEENGDDAGAALLRHVAGRIEYGLENLKKTAELLYFHNTVMRKRLGESKAESPAEDTPTRDAGALDRELRFYRSHLDDMLGPGDVNEGMHVVIKGEDVAGCATRSRRR